MESIANDQKSGFAQTTTKKVEPRDGAFAYFKSFMNSNLTKSFAELYNINPRILKTLPIMSPAMHLFCSVLHLLVATQP